MTYTHRPSPHKTAANAVNADAMRKNTVNQNTAEPKDTSSNAVGNPKSTAKKTANLSSSPPVSKLPPSLGAQKQHKVQICSANPWFCFIAESCNFHSILHFANLLICFLS